MSPGAWLDQEPGVRSVLAQIDCEIRHCAGWDRPVDVQLVRGVLMAVLHVEAPADVVPVTAMALKASEGMITDWLYLTPMPVDPLGTRFRRPTIREHLMMLEDYRRQQMMAWIFLWPRDLVESFEARGLAWPWEEASRHGEI